MDSPPKTEKLPTSGNDSQGRIRLRTGNVAPTGHNVEFRGYLSNQPAPPKSTAIKAGWILLSIGMILACIPIIGFASWVIGYPLCFAALIIGCIGAANGRPMAGVVLILASITVVPVALLVAPFVSLFLVAEPAPKESTIEEAKPLVTPATSLPNSGP